MLSLIAKLGLDSSAFNTGLAKAKLSAKEFGGGVTSYFKDAISGSIGKYLAAGTAFAAFASLGMKLVESSREIKNWSEQLDISTDDVQRLMKVARRSGLEFEQMARGMEKFGEARGKALEGDAEKLAVFAKYRVPMEMLRSNLYTNLDVIGKMMAAIPSTGLTGGERVQLGELFGRHGERLIAPFERLKSMGPINLIDKDDVESLSRAKGTIEAIGKYYLVKASRPIADLSSIAQAITNPDEKDLGNIEAFGAMFNAAMDYSTLEGQLLSLFNGGGIFNRMNAAADKVRRRQAIRNIKDLPNDVPGGDFLPKDAQHKKESRIPFARDADTLAKQGLFVGGAGNPMVNLQQRQLDATRDTLNEIRGLRRDVQQRL